MQHSRPASAAAVRPRPSSAAAFRVEEAEFEMPEIKEALDELRLAQNDVTQSVISTVKESNFSPELVIVVTKIVCTIVGEEVPKDLKSAKMKLGIQGLRSRMISKKTCDVSDPDAIMLAKYIRQLSILDMPRTPAVMKLVRWISLYVRVVQMLRRTTKKNRKLVAEYFLNPLLQEESSPTSALDNEMALGKLAARDLVGPAPQTQSNDPIVVLESYLKSLKSLQSNLNSGAQVGPPIIKVDLELTSEKEPFTHSPIFRNVDDTVPIPDETMDDADAWSAALAVPSSTHRLQKIEMRPSARESNSAVVELRLREAENTLLKQQLAESEAAIRSAKEQTSSLSLHVDKATEVLKDHEVILRNSLRSIVDNAKREAEQIGVQMLHSSQSLRSDLVERGSALNNLNSRLEYLSSVSSPIQRPNRANVSQHSLRVAESSDESGHKHFEPSGSSFGSGDTAPEPNSSRTPDVGFEKIQTLQHQSVSHDNLMPKGAHTTQAELSLQMQLHESTLSKAVLLQKLEAQESKLQQLSAQLEEQLQFRERRPQQNDPINVDGLESANLSAVLISRVRELEEEVGALKQSNKHMTVELEKSIKVAKAFESRSHEDEVRYNDASQALTNWKRTAQELGHQAADLRDQFRQLMTQSELLQRERDTARAECAQLSQLTKDFSQSRESTESALQNAVLRAAASEHQHSAISAELHQLRVAFEGLDARYKETALLLRESDNRNRSLKEEISRITEKLLHVDSESRMLRERSMSAEAALNAHVAQKEMAEAALNAPVGQKEFMTDKRREY